MKTYKILFIILISSLFAVSSFSQAPAKAQPNTVKSSVVTETFKVWGKCSMCKARIEKAALSEGAIKASWDQNTLMLNVTFDSSKVTKDNLCRKIASVGHDTEKYRAPDDVYANLPECCHYERPAKK
ncbi:MAG: hypothetical protein WBJ37_04445 [Bacteroidales bacterium]